MEVLSESQQSQPGPSSSSSSSSSQQQQLVPSNLSTSGSSSAFSSPSTVGSIFRPLPQITTSPPTLSDPNLDSNPTGLNLSTSGLGNVGGSPGPSSSSAAAAAAALVGVNVVANVVASLDHHLHSHHDQIHQSFQSQLGNQSSSQHIHYHQVTNPNQISGSSGQQQTSYSPSSLASFAEPALKRLRTNSPGSSNLYHTSPPGYSGHHLSGQFTGSSIVDKLERRLNAVLCCAVCMDLPRSQVFQCTNGHLMCSPCFTHCLADARLKDETATCPSCRCVITRDSCSRNLAVEKAVSELPGTCRFCERELPRSQLDRHEMESCEERIIGCSFSRLGCPWKGPYHEIGNHESNCPHPSKSGRDILSSLESLDRDAKEERKLYDSIFDLLSFEKITFHDLQFKGYRTEEFIHRLYYETARFTAFNNQWVVKARVNENEKDPSQVCDRRLSYQLVLKTKLQSPLAIHYLILKGPFGDMKVNPRLNRFEFSESTNESPYVNLPLVDSNECNKLLATKAINFRLIMFQMPK